MKKLLYTCFIGVLVSTVFVVISHNEKNKNLQLDSNKKPTYCLNDLCVDLMSLDYDFSVTRYTHELFLSTNSKEIKIGEDSIYVYIYQSEYLMEEDASRLIKYDVNLQSLLCLDGNSSSFYKKSRIIVQYNGHDENIKKSLDSILCLAFLDVS